MSSVNSKMKIKGKVRNRASENIKYEGFRKCVKVYCSDIQGCHTFGRFKKGSLKEETLNYHRTASYAEE